jgi:hypothetical protein
MLEQENERFMRTLVHVFNAEQEASASQDEKPVVAVKIPG